MPVVQYHFRHAVNAFFEITTERARHLLPPHLAPLELRHGSGILGVTAFDFHQSEVGAYGEIVLSVIVPPLLTPGRPFPRSAQFPLIVGTSTAASRQHAIERWHLPHYLQDVRAEFAEADGRMQVHVREGARPVLDFSITEHQWSDVRQLYQIFMLDQGGRYKVDFHAEGRFSEHEEETGSLALHDHPLCAGLSTRDVAGAPFREMWMKDGVQSFDELELL